MRLLRGGSAQGLSGQLVRGGVGSLGIKIGNVLLGLMVAVLLARVLGPEGYGLYAYVFAVVSILAIPAQFGLPRLVVRETAKAHVSQNWGLMRGVWRWTTAVVVGLCALLVALGLIGSWLWGDRFSEVHVATFVAGLVLIPVIALGNLRGAALQGLGRVLQGQLPEHVLRPGLLLLMVSTAVLVKSDGLSPTQAMALNVLAALVAFWVGAGLLLRSRPEAMKGGPAPVYESRAWAAAAWPLALTAGMQQINNNTDLVILGFFASDADVGVYRVAVQGATLVVFGLQVVTMFVAPYFARLYAQGDLARLRRLATASAQASVLVAIPLALGFILFGDWIIEVVFGSEYAEARVPLIILSVGQAVNAMFGPVGVLLNMTGHERETARGMAIAAVLNVVLNLVLIPPLGMLGAALATALSLMTWNLVLWRAVRLHLGINSHALSRA